MIKYSDCYNRRVTFFKKIMRLAVIFVLCFLIGAGGIIGYHYLTVKIRSGKPFVPFTTTFTSLPPQQSIGATLTVLNGIITEYSRNSTEAASISDSTRLVQGDSIESDATSSAQLVFDNNLYLEMGPSANLQFIDTIPSELLLWQQDGQIEYSSTASATPITIRSLSLLTTIASSSATITVNAPKPRQITILSGLAPIKVAYQDKDANTHVVDLPPTTRAIYTHSTRLLTLPRTTPKRVNPLRSLLRK